MRHTLVAGATQAQLDNPAKNFPADIVASNSLADLAARIRAEHEKVVLALKRGVERAIAAGDLLIEAKALLKHGQWLPWLRDDVGIPARTATRYMELARHA